MIRAEDEAYDELRAAIRTGRLQPNQRLVEAELAQAFGVGRGAVRMALARLEQEGIVERERHRGARVRLVSEAEAIEILEARAALEGVAAAYAARNASAADVAELRGLVREMSALLKAGDLLGYSACNPRLHQKVLELAQNRTVSRLAEMLDAQNVRHQFRTILAPGRPARSFEEHREIVDAIARRDPARAEEAMRRHLRNVSEELRMLAASSALAS
jgi:DNA-binding GntR family transcriptional regulator